MEQNKNVNPKAIPNTDDMVGEIFFSIASSLPDAIKLGNQVDGLLISRYPILHERLANTNLIIDDATYTFGIRELNGYYLKNVDESSENVEDKAVTVVPQNIPDPAIETTDTKFSHDHPLSTKGFTTPLTDSTLADLGAVLDQGFESSNDFEVIPTDAGDSSAVGDGAADIRHLDLKLKDRKRYLDGFTDSRETTHKHTGYPTNPDYTADPKLRPASIQLNMFIRVDPEV